MMNPMFYFLLALTVVLAKTPDDYTIVQDSDGDSISAIDGSYYLISRDNDAEGGGLTLAPRGVNKCPLYIGLEDYNMGIPVRFSNWSSGNLLLTVSESLNIEMDIKDTICSESTYWRITPSVVPRTVFITAGPKPLNRLFQIKQGSFVGGYQIYFCPHGSNCTIVGLFVDQNGVRRLALNSTTFEFWIIKATEPETSSNTMSIT